MTRDIRNLVKHLEEQIAHKDAREPSCDWITGKLKKYLDEKDTISEIILNETVCKWCSLPRKGRHAVHMESFGSFPVCEECFDLYLKADFEELKVRIKPESKFEFKV